MANENSANSPVVHRINNVDYVTATDAATYLGVHYSTVLNRVNSRHQYLKSKKIGATLCITVDSLEEDKARLNAKAVAA